MQHHPCPCCGHLVFPEPPGSHDICPICCWEDDRVQLRWPSYAVGANALSLLEAQRNYLAFGAVEPRLRNQGRPPRDDELVDAGWRPIDPQRDRFEPAEADDARRPWPDDLAVLYWWRSTFWGDGS